MNLLTNKKLAALFSIFSNSLLILLKLIVGVITGSVSILSEAVHSVTDLLASIITFFSVKVSSEPADSKHPFGHGKFEDISGFIEGSLLLVAAAYIIFEAIEKILTGKIESINVTYGIPIMFISVVLNIFVSFYLFKVAQKTQSMALFADAQHLRMDIYTSFGVFMGLVLIKITGLSILDPIIAMLIALMIVKTGVDICKETAESLLDSSLPEKDQNLIKKIFKKYMPEQIIELKLLKTRKAGNNKLIEAVLTVPENLTIKEGHILCDEIEKELSEYFEFLNINIHLEPCNSSCTGCELYKKNIEICKNLKNQKR